MIKADTETDIVAVGECLIDFVSGQHADTLVLEGHPGGAPANVLAMAAKLRCSTQMIAKVGMDAFGSFLIEQLKKAKIGTTGMVQATKEATTLAIVSLDTAGNRSFGFYRNGTADVQLELSEIDKTLLKTCKLFHFGSVSMTSEPARSATLKAALMAKEAGALISYDPNLRAPLWEDLAQAKKMILEGMHLADVVKLSAEELEFLSSADLRPGAELLYQEYKMKLLVVTLGPGGCVCRMKQGFFTSATFDVACVDTTGAGDAFLGALLASILKEPILLEDYSPGQINALLDFANAAGALATTKKGAIPAMPNEEEIQNCIETLPRCRQGA